jgi:hypothetical protein
MFATEFLRALGRVALIARQFALCNPDVTDGGIRVPREFLYVDSDKVRALFGQLTEGATLLDSTVKVSVDRKLSYRQCG